MIEYTLSMPAPHTHLFEVEVRVAAPETPLDLVMPSWTPGSYLMREYPRNVQDLTAHDASGLRLACRKTDKNTWRIEGDATGAIVVRYRVYANEVTVRTSHLDSTHGYVNGASVFMYVRGREAEEIRVRIERPEGWRIATSLRAQEEEELFAAADYDELVDCPIEIGEHRTIAWEEEGVPHRFAIWGSGPLDEARLLADTRRIIGVCSELFGGLPYDRYLFLLHIAPGGRGGLEHRTSTSLLVGPEMVSGPGYERLISLVAHEFFHVWMGKRIRPAPLGPFDYTRENYTRNLWVVEGFTTYYTDLILVRAGLMTRERYLARLGDMIARYEALPGRHHQSLEESSFDAWIRFYRPDAHTPNSQVSYYQKGALVAMVLDLEIRRASEGERSLDDVLRLLWERYGKTDVGFPEAGPGGIQEVIEEVYGGSMEEWFDAYIRGTGEIDFDGHLAGVGLRMAEAGVEGTEEGAGGEGQDAAGGMGNPRVEGRGAIGGDGEDRGDRRRSGAAPAAAVRAVEGPPMVAPPVHERRLGVRLREEAGRLRVAVVLAGGAAHEAGVNAGDELVAVDGVRATVAGLTERVGRAEAGEVLTLTLMRRDAVVGAGVVVPPHTPWRGTLVEDAAGGGGGFGWLDRWVDGGLERG